jgi:hypothetical protein
MGKRRDDSIQCWGPGGMWRNGECTATLPDSEHATMRRLGWGFTMDHEAAENYYACQEHKDEHVSRES